MPLKITSFTINFPQLIVPKHYIWMYIIYCIFIHIFNLEPDIYIYIYVYIRLSNLGLDLIFAMVFCHPSAGCQDSDGSVGLAAVLPPRRPQRSPRPVLVSLSGVGVEPQGQADAYKLKRREEETFVDDTLW